MSCEFSVDHYRELLTAARDGGYRFAGFDRGPEAGDLIVRHDVDLSLEAALALAEVEAELGAWSTWFLMTRSVFYNLDSAAGRETIARLRELGHRVGHHAVWPDVDLDDRFDPVVAWHNPDPAYMSAPIDGAVNQDAWALHVAERSMLEVLEVLDADARRLQAALPEATPVALPGGAPAAGVDQRIAENVSKYETNSRDVAFETLLNEQPWNPVQRIG